MIESLDDAMSRRRLSGAELDARMRMAECAARAATKRHLKRKDAKAQRTESDGGGFLERRNSQVLSPKIYAECNELKG
jgi:hypothetical protein